MSHTRHGAAHTTKLWHIKQNIGGLAARTLYSFVPPGPHAQNPGRMVAMVAESNQPCVIVLLDHVPVSPKTHRTTATML